MPRVSHPIQGAIARHGAVILDGATSTELEALGADCSDPLWTAKVLLEEPEKVRQCHAAYWEAGAMVAETCTYQATEAGFARRGLAREDAARVIESAVDLADDARQAHLAAFPGTDPRDLIIAGSIGPYGAYLADGSEYTGRYGLTQAEYRSFHALRFAALAEDGRVDVIALETHPRIDELRAELAMALEMRVPCWVSVTLSADGLHMPDGTPLSELAALCDAHERVEAVGINCVSRERVLPALQELARATGKPLVVYPNSGETYDPQTKTWSGCCAHAHEWRGLAESWHRAGARVIGGCCRTLPADIAAMRGLLIEQGLFRP